MFTRIRLHCESVLIRVCLIFTFTLSHLNEYPKWTDLKMPTKVGTYLNTVFLQVCKQVKRHPLECVHKVKRTHINVDQKKVSYSNTSDLQTCLCTCTCG